MSSLSTKREKTIAVVINGYVRKMENMLHPTIIPLRINQIIHTFYDLGSDREILSKAFEQYIDPDYNQDADVEEWLLGLEKLNVTLNEKMSRKMFELMDKDKTGFIAKEDFVSFCTSFSRDIKIDSDDLQALQMAVLEAIPSQNVHARTHENWGPHYCIRALENEMKALILTAMNEESITE